MEKVFKILVVFALLMLLILLSIRTKKWREYGFSHRIPDNPPEWDEPEGMASIISHQGVAIVTDESTGLVYRYAVQGVLTIFRQHSSKELQRLAAPPDAYYLVVDPVKDEIHLHQEGEIYIYTRTTGA